MSPVGSRRYPFRPSNGSIVLARVGAAVLNAPPWPARPWHSKQPLAIKTFLPLAASPLGASWASAGRASERTVAASSAARRQHISMTRLPPDPGPPRSAPTLRAPPPPPPLPAPPPRPPPPSPPPPPHAH